MKYNRVTFYGIAVQVPRIIKAESGEYIKALFPLSVVKSERYTGETSSLLTQNVPIILSENPEIIQKMDKIQKFDSVYLKGVLMTRSVPKETICPECQAKQLRDGMIVCVVPIYLEIVKSNACEREAIDDLYAHKEISNEVMVIGNLCFDPIKVKTISKNIVAEYQIAITRTYRLDEEKTDFPWIKSYGDNAKEDLKRLRTGSGVLVDGCIQARNARGHSTCECCGTVYPWMNPAMEIVPYETEYLSHYITDEDIKFAEEQMD